MFGTDDIEPEFCLYFFSNFQFASVVRSNLDRFRSVQTVSHGFPRVQSAFHSLAFFYEGTAFSLDGYGATSMTRSLKAKQICASIGG